MSDNGITSSGGDESSHGTAKSSSKAKAELEKDVERLEATLSAERFCTVVVIIVVFDAFMFKDFGRYVLAERLDFQVCDQVKGGGCRPHRDLVVAPYTL
jgi:hypothetical protein